MAKLIYTFITVLFLVEATAESCERDKSRTVRNLVYQELAPLYRSVGAKIPNKCPFFKDRDRYLGQEEHKEREAPTRWSCNYCGKAFIGEVYLDKHLARRHSDQIYKAADSVCLADYCEIFRCDVHSGVAKPTFWDLALCMDDDMKDLAQDCQELLTGCLPDSLNWNASKTLLSALNSSLCSYLTCKTYYDAASLQDEEPPGTSYVVLSLLLGASLIIYYCVAVNYFWLDTFSDIYDLDDYIQKSPNSLFSDKSNESLPPPLRLPRRKTNIIQSEFASTDQDMFNARKRLDNMAQENGAMANSNRNPSNSGPNRQPGLSLFNKEKVYQTDELFTLRQKKDQKYTRRSPKEKSKSPSPSTVKSRSKASLEKDVITVGASAAAFGAGGNSGSPAEGALGVFSNVEMSTQEEQLKALSEAGVKFMEKVKQQSKENPDIAGDNTKAEAVSQSRVEDEPSLSHDS